MNGDYVQNRRLDCLSVRRLPARLTAEQAAQLLGFAAHDIPVLIKARLLKCLGNPVPNSVKHFARYQLEELGNDVSWLNKATAAVSECWRQQNAKRTRSSPPT